MGVAGGIFEGKSPEPSEAVTTSESTLPGLIFHEHWWLAAATGGQFSEVEVKHGDTLLGRLPFVIVRKRGFRTLRMPPFTHLLGPSVTSGNGKLQTRLKNRLSTVRSLIDQLPPVDFFKLGMDPSVDDGLALADGLAFQDRGYQTKIQYTFQIDCRRTLEELFAEMNFKVRQHVRRAEKLYTVNTITDPQQFVSFYNENLEKRGLKSSVAFDNFEAVFDACRARSCGQIIAAVDSGNDQVGAMTFLVWGNGIMYYLLSTRAGDESNSGVINLLIWTAMKKANELGLAFDLDGVTTPGTAQFLNGFGGQIKPRLVVTYAKPLYEQLRLFRNLFLPDKTAYHT